ncbi:probable methyltransferase At1g29790 [Andrographis paniculata]|uniref:probable methyltransferase At1g29790 n=1 Tax=Andrographis paniculata TaxID=175694 RepID=UPI0021E82C75|nr:probable methyltransferase At1g29790 [Andrographis paniculata]
MNVSEEAMSKKQSSPHHTQINQKLKFLFLVILTNLLTIFIFTASSSHISTTLFQLPGPGPVPDVAALLIELNATRHEVVAGRAQIAALQKSLIAMQFDSPMRSGPRFDDLVANLSNEAELSIGPHKLPLGYNRRMGSDEVYFSVGAGCLKHKHELAKYTSSYRVGGECPVDDVFAQELMLKGCEPLPRRRCHPKSPENYVEPTPFPDCLWTTPPDASLVWDAYSCKNYSCLIERRRARGSFDCKDCFYLEGREKHRWLYDNGGLDFGIDQVLATRRPGTLRIGLDIGGGSGTFAARMKEKGVTIVTTSMNFDGPFNSFIASRGLIPMHVSISQRLPFFDNTLDIIHSMHVLSNWIPDAMLEFILYDIYRALRPGGLFWLDRFFCLGSQLNSTYVPMFDRVGFGKVRWYAGMKLDRGVKKNEWYLSALLEKPKT